MKLATAFEMRELDRQAVERYGIPGIVLMENAGRGAVSEIVGRWGPARGRRYVVFCGKGSNGGDGLVIARHLSNMGAKVAVRLLSEDMKGDALANLEAARKMGMDVRTVSPGLAAEGLEVRHADLVVDALFGTGLASEVGGPYREVIELINGYAGCVVSADMPSGVDSDHGRIMGAAVRADMTVTFGLPKRGLYLYPGAQMAGEIRVVDISIPAEAVNKAGIPAGLLTASTLEGLLPGRAPDSNKGDYGHLLILAGSAGKTGAAVMAARAASRTGAGLVTLGVPEGLSAVFEEKLTEEMTRPLPETRGHALSSRALDEVLEILKGKSALAVGPGISTDPDTARLMAELLPRVDVPLLIDADGLNILAADDAPLRRLKADTVLTPHPGEMGRLLGVPAREVQSDRPAAALRLAREYGVTVALKGARTLVASPDGSFHINTTGNPGMATGGTGDVLTGMVASLMAQGMPAAEAARLGVYLHGCAGDMAAHEKGQAGLIAGDVIDFIPYSIKAYNS